MKKIIILSILCWWTTSYAQPNFLDTLEARRLQRGLQLGIDPSERATTIYFPITFIVTDITHTDHISGFLAVVNAVFYEATQVYCVRGGVHIRPDLADIHSYDALLEYPRKLQILPAKGCAIIFARYNDSNHPGRNGLASATYRVGVVNTSASNVFAHEIGHILGLGHYPHKDNVMYQYYDRAANLTPQQINFIRNRYGR
jgi:hypothetical protein